MTDEEIMEWLKPMYPQEAERRNLLSLYRQIEAKVRQEQREADVRLLRPFVAVIRDTPVLSYQDAGEWLAAQPLGK